MNRIPMVVSMTLAMGLGACAPPRAADSSTWQAETVVLGDTTIVRTLAGSRWDAPREARIELSIGSLEGPEETMFGFVGALAVDAQGGVYAYDGQVPVIRYFDPDGQFVRQVGREGQGPGEYLDAVLGMGLQPDGRLEIRDARNGRVTLYEPDGTFSEQWSVASGLFTGDAMFIDNRGHTYLKVLQEQPTAGEPWKIGLLHLDATGSIVDTLPDPWVADPPRGDGGSLSPSKRWTFGPGGEVVVGVNDTYEFEIRRPDGTVTRIQRESEPQRVSDEEFAAYEARREYSIRTQGQFMTTLPGETRRVKPAYRSLDAGSDGRVWVWLYGPVELKPGYEPAAEGEAPRWPFVEPKLFDVFEPDGAYLGQVHVPADVTVSIFGTDELWGVRRGPLGENYIVRMGLHALAPPTDGTRSPERP